MNAELKQFMERLAEEIYRRYQDCPDTTTPDSILLAVANAIHEVIQSEGGDA